MILSWCNGMTVSLTRRAQLDPILMPGDAFPQGKAVLMEKNTQEELKAHLMATSEEFRSLAEKHAEYHKLLEQLESKAHLSMEDEAEEQRLKKQKLRLKDQMNQIMSQHRAQHVA